MDTAREPMDDPNRRELSAAPIERRLGASLLDSAAALLLVFSGSQLLSFVYDHAPSWFVGAYLTAFQVCVLSWTLGKDSWWRGQGIGKKFAGVFLAVASTQNPASRLRCIWRQVIFVLMVLALYLPVYLSVISSPAMVGAAVASSLVSVAAPVRLVMFLVPTQMKSAGDMVVAHFLVMGFMVLEALMVLSRRDGRRIIDLLAGTQVLSAGSKVEAQSSS